MHVTKEEQSQINRLVAEAEARSGTQVLIAIVDKADAYPEIPWKAFAMGAVFSAFLVAANAIYFPDGSASRAGILVSSVMVAGATLAALTVFIPAFARLFLTRLRAESEVRQYAEAVFLQRGLFETRRRVGLLLLIARFEREAVIVADIGVRQHVTDGQLAAVAAQVKPLLAQKRLMQACASCLSAVALLLQDRLTPRAIAVNEVPDTLIQERGA
ncbi:MAG TPA: TPM domain-containing protein [Burkholderiales bacterium]|nr:TPM domain-containing protein [Burkholderiales bacterium]